jgi:hypothetical protein
LVQNSGSATLHFSKISGNTGLGVSNTTGVTVDATRNWWGSAAGPGGSNNGVSSDVTYDPWAAALIESTTASTHEIGETGTLETRVTANGLYGAQLRVTHDSSILTFDRPNSTHNDVGGFFWDTVPENFVEVSGPGDIRLSGSMWAGYGHTTGANVANANLATWRYTCTGVGTSALMYDTTAGFGTKLSDKDGFEIPAAFVGDSITCVAATGSVSGVIELQGRVQGAASPAGWNDAVVTLTCEGGSCAGSGPYTFVTGVNGAYQLLKSGPGTGIAQGTYTATVWRRAYLGATKTGIVIGSGTTTLTRPKLLGGDVDNDGQVYVNDLSAVGGAFGTTPPADTGPDINGDGVVNIFDLVLVGGNYYLTSSIWP